MIPVYKKYSLLALFFFLGVTQLIWFWMAPENFKSVWKNNLLVAHIIKQHNLIEEKSKILTISYYYPGLSYFAHFIIGDERPDKGRIGGSFHTYYQMAVDLMPNIDAAHFLLGFCEYYMGNPDEARLQFEKSVDLNPYYFWSYYNLGVIYFKQGDFLQSAVILNKTFTLKNEITLGILHQDPFYQQIWHYLDDPGQILESDLSEGKNDAALLLADCFVKAGARPQALQIIQHVGQGSIRHKEIWDRLKKIAVSRQSITDDIDRLIQEQIPVRLF